MPKAKNTKRQEPPELLKGWKAIGNYLGIGAATAQRWAKGGMKREGRYTVAQRNVRRFPSSEVLFTLENFTMHSLPLRRGRFVQGFASATDVGEADLLA